MADLASVVDRAGGRAVRFNFLYRALGKSVPDRMPKLIATYRDVIGSVRDRLDPRRLVIGGHSMGGRVASMLEAEVPAADGILLFGYPLHPAGDPTKLRDAHLGAISAPTLCFNGTEDALCDRGEMEAALVRAANARWTMHWLEGADHSYSVRKASGRTRGEVFAEAEAALRRWLASLG